MVTVKQNGKVLRTRNLRVRLKPEEKKLLVDMMREDLIPNESIFVRRLIFAEARRRAEARQSAAEKSQAKEGAS